MTSFQCITYALLAAFAPILDAAPRAQQNISSAPLISATNIKTQSADVPMTTPDGNRFILPAGWSMASVGQALVLTPPEGGSHIVLVDITAKDADAAVAMAWALYHKNARWPLKLASDRSPRDGWAQNRFYEYETALSDKRSVFARALKRGERWTVMIHDVDNAVGAKRVAQIERLLGSLVGKGYVRETFAGKTANKLDAKRIEALTQFLDAARQELNIPGVALGIVQDGKVVFAGGFGVRELGKPDKVDADTLFLSASVTKPLTTLMLAKLVDAGKFNWDTPVVEVLPTFKLGDAETSRQLQMKHLVCACTGLPRRDMEWIFNSEGSTPATVMTMLGTMKPNSKLGDLYQYSNILAAAGGFVGGHALYPSQELGAAYDASMQTLVFDPLGMKATTFDFARAQRGNYAAPHAEDVDGNTVRAEMGHNYTGISMRPDGGAWSNINDLLQYVQMELHNGLLPDGQRYINQAPLLARREQQVARGGENQGYGMGLKIDRNQGTPLVWHGGSMVGYQAEVLWLPEHKVGVVLLFNANAGAYLRGLFKSRLMEVLFDAEPKAFKNLAAQSKRMKEDIVTERKTFTLPADPTVIDVLASHYRSAELGSIKVVRKSSSTWLDFGDWQSEIATQREEDGTHVLLSISPGVRGYRFIVVNRSGRRSLILRDEQREYVLDEVK